MTLQYPFIDGSVQLPTNHVRTQLLKGTAHKLRAEKRRDLDILEIGSLFGHSACILSEYGIVLCVDSWPYGQVDFFKVTRDKPIGSIVGDSNVVLPTLPDQSYDLIYIDGDHRFPTVNNDIVQAKRLIKKGGIICGDDLEIKVNALTYGEVSLLRTQDYINGFHPGVSCAIYEEFNNEVNMLEGFWWKNL